MTQDITDSSSRQALADVLAVPRVKTKAGTTAPHVKTKAGTSFLSYYYLALRIT